MYMFARLGAKKASKKTQQSEKKVCQTGLSQKKASEAEDNVEIDDQEASEKKVYQTRLSAKKASNNTQPSEMKVYQTRLSQKKASEAEDNVTTDDQEASEAEDNVATDDQEASEAKIFMKLNHDEIDKIEVEVQTWIQLKHMLKNGSVKTVNRGRYVANNPKIKVALNKIHLPESYRETDFVPLKLGQQ
ncbi:MAG: hypothetical protein EZS28_032486 [Streblomastix strix]|uniref:Uncharacterized protein n=1 Tax=Streblomastix strix TaxID=222440 RepID=A0A5J4UMS8_9EUKA|nr:MAG: hypothetical protein EZS28_032486 [Streblomastix strix]